MQKGDLVVLKKDNSLRNEIGIITEEIHNLTFKNLRAYLNLRFIIKFKKNSREAYHLEIEKKNLILISRHKK